MGGNMSTPDTSAKERSDEIDRQIEEDSKRFNRESMVLVLGTSGSGKTTVINQMKILCGDGFAPDELVGFVSIVHRSVFDCAYQVVAYMKKVGIECVEAGNQVLAEHIYKHTPLTPEWDSEPILAPEIAQAIHRFWKDPIFPMVVGGHSSDLYSMDNAPYFFDEVLRIGTPGYLPNETDILHTRVKTVGLNVTRLSMGPSLIHLIDIGDQRSERKKWFHCFERVTSIMFCAALSDYDQNRMNESLLLFETVINSRWFIHSSVILLLNKTDMFKRKLSKVPLGRYFPEYTGGNDINKAAKYILWKFMQANRARLTVYPHLTQATNPVSNITSIVSFVVNEMPLW